MSNWPQWTYLAGYAVGFVYVLYLDGKKGAKFTGVFATIVVYVVPLTVLYYGGFWAPLGFAP